MLALSHKPFTLYLGSYAYWLAWVPASKSAVADPTVPPPNQFSNGSPQTTCTVFCSNDFKIWQPLSNVRHPGSVRMVRGIVIRGG
jgi:hypothetical protein